MNRAPAANESPLKICHVQVLPLMSGVQRSMIEIFRHLDRRRYVPYVVCQSEGPLTDELERLAVPYLLVPSLVRPIRPWSDLRAYWALRSIFSEHRFHVVHTHSSKPGVLARLAARHAGVPRIVHHVRGYAFHEFSPSYQRAAFSRVEKWVGSFSDRVIFVNEEERRLSIHKGWLPEEKCLTIYNGVDLQAFSPVSPGPRRVASRAAFGLTPGDVAILFVGRLETQKQPLLLPAIAAELQSIRPQPNWRILVAGSGRLQAELAAAVDRFGVDCRVQRLGWRSDTEEVYRAADIVLLPSLWEGLPRTLIEAQAAGRPIVASNIKGNREIVTEDTGFLCSPRDAPEYARCLARLIDSPLLRREMGQAARQRAETLFDSTTNNRLIVELYDKLFSKWNGAVYSSPADASARDCWGSSL